MADKLDLTEVASPYQAEEDTAVTQEISASAEDLAKAAKESLDFLAALAMPTVYKFAYPPVLLSVWQWITGFAHTWRTFPQLALGLPRGFSKTTLMKLVVLYCILFTDRKFILIISSTARLAENILADIADMLDEPNIKAVFGDWRIGLIKDTQQMKKFGFRGRDITIAAIGAGGSMRGLNVNNERPDVMLFEDVQTAEDAESAQVSEQLFKWMLGTAMKAKSPEGCLYLFVANMYATPHSILRKLKSDPTWTKFIAGGILHDGTSLWEELHPIKQLLAEYQRDCAAGFPQIFYSEVLNDENASANNLCDTSKIPACSYTSDDIPIWKYIIVDPSSSNKKTADAVSIGYFEAFDRGRPVCKEIIEGQMTAPETVRKAITLALTRNCRLVVYEAVAHQESLCYWHEFICKQMGIEGLLAAPIWPGGQSKERRIIKMFRSLLQGEIELAAEVRPQVFLQIMQFNPMKTDNVDGILDLLTYCQRVPVEMNEQALSVILHEDQEFLADADEPFDGYDF